MYLPIVEEPVNAQTSIRAWQGYNHNLIVNDGEMYDEKNMTGDYYPLLSPRKKRKIILEAASTDWVQQEAEFTSTFIGELTSARAEYAATISGGPLQNYRMRFNMAAAYVESAEIACSALDEDGEVLQEYTPEQDEVFITPAGTTQISIMITAYALDVSQFREEDIDTYITNIAIEKRNELMRGILMKENKLAYMIGSTVYYNGETYDMSPYIPEGDDRISDVQMLNYGAYILIFPMGIYINTATPGDIGYLGARATYAGSVSYALCDRYGNAYSATAAATAPSNPTAGQYWLDTKSIGLYVWDAGMRMWSAVLTTYIKIEAAGINMQDYFAVGDAVYMNTNMTAVNSGSVIVGIGQHYIIVTGIMSTSSTSQTFTSLDPFVIERRIPKLDYVCVSNNRVWGCFYGKDDDGNLLNEIYASKLADPKNWYCYAGSASDSYAVSVGSDGVWTGCIMYQGYPTFFKENVIYKIYGSYPATYQLVTLDSRGVQDGSYRSLAICGEYLLYKSAIDVCVFDGSRPTAISKNLGISELFYNAVGGACLNKYYISMMDEEGIYHLYVYEMDRGVWHKDETIEIQQFAYTTGGQLYGHNGTTVYGFENATETLGMERQKTEDFVEWYAITGEFGYEYPEHKYVSRITLRAEIPFHSEIRVSIAYDDKSFEELIVMRGDGRPGTKSFHAKPMRCDHYRLKFEGHGDARIYTMLITLDVGSEES